MLVDRHVRAAPAGEEVQDLQHRVLVLLTLLVSKTGPQCFQLLLQPLTGDALVPQPHNGVAERQCRRLGGRYSSVPQGVRPSGSSHLVGLGT